MKITKLPDSLINRIAAGEVIERPAFVIKELIENSIDANSTEIYIDIKNGGRSSIIVSDNGNGIEKNDLKLSVQRHATSKLKDEDLNNIKYLGFRGEALPSIAAVSNLSIESKEKGKSESWVINVDNNEEIEYSPSSRANGTKVSVIDLFKRVPARLKFLKSNNGENLHSKQIIRRLALCNPKIRFKLRIDNKDFFDVDNNAYDGNELLSRISSILGQDFVKNSIEFNNKYFYNKDPITIQGFISLPSFTRGNQIRQYIFVNGRPIQDRGLSSIIRMSYKDTLARGRHPLYCIFLSVPNQFLDINVHPTKLEVRFQDYNFIKSIIISAINNVLILKNNKPIDLGLGDLKPSNGFLPKYQERALESQIILNGLKNYNSIKNTIESQKSGEEIRLIDENHQPLGQAIYQFKQNYILSISSSGLIIIDQHAAHERLLLEKFKKKFENNYVENQLLLIPVIIDLELDQLDSFKANIKIFNKLGFDIEEFGKSSIIVRSIPTLLFNFDIEEIIKDLCDDIKTKGFPADYQERVKLIIGNICCHKAIRSGRVLTTEEMNSLLREMEDTPNSGQCNHGRPTSITLNIKQIEKLFQRT